VKCSRCSRSEEFTARLTLLTGRDADDIRARYIAHFVDTTTAYYHEHIARLSPHSDGVAYDGYLWDSLAEGRQIIENEVREVELLDTQSACSGICTAEIKSGLQTAPIGDFLKGPYSNSGIANLLAGQDYLPE